MGVMYAMKCDLCGILQVKEDASDIQGSTYNENGVMKFSCMKCKSLMKAAFEIKRRGLKDPLSKVAGLIEQRDKAKREKDEALEALRGENPFAALTVGDPKAALRGAQQPGQAIPLANRPPQTGALPLADRHQRIGHEISRKSHGKKH
jgi:hypothetical protein